MQFWTSLALLLLLLTSTPAGAAVYYVSSSSNSPAGSDARSCATATNIATPKATIRDTINNCARNPGDTVQVRGGTYPEQLHAFFGTNWPSGSSWSAPITVAGSPGETVVINPFSTEDHFDLLYTTAAYLIFQNLTWDASNVHAFNGGSVLRFGDHIKVLGCVMRNYVPNDGNITDTFTQHANGILAGQTDIEIRDSEFFNLGYGIYLSESIGNLVDRNYIHDTRGYGIHQYTSGTTMSNNNVIRNNRIQRSSGYPGTPQTGCGVVISRGDNNQVYNNVIIDAVYGCGVQVYGQNSNAKVFYNTIVGNARPCVFIDANGTGAQIRNNLCYNNGEENGQEIINNGSGSIIDHNWLSSNGNPQFVNLPGGDFHLTQASPDAVRNGGIAGTGITVDIENRPRDATPSLGAYEFSSAGGPLPPPVDGDVCAPCSLNLPGLCCQCGLGQAPSSGIPICQ